MTNCHILINSIINEKYMAWFERTDVVDTLGSRISFLRKWVNEQCLDLQKQKKIKKQFLTYWDSPYQWGKEYEKRRKRKFYKKKSFTSREVKNIEENIITNRVLKSIDFLGKLLIAQQERTTANVGHVEK